MNNFYNAQTEAAAAIDAAHGFLRTRLHSGSIDDGSQHLARLYLARVALDTAAEELGPDPLHFVCGLLHFELKDYAQQVAARMSELLKRVAADGWDAATLQASTESTSQ